MPKIAFLVGAGFNADAAAVAGVSECGYPLLPDLANRCFGLSDHVKVDDIESRFAQAVLERNAGPLEQLAEIMFEADNVIGSTLGQQKDSPSNVYARFFRDFPSEAILTFNYDSLVELLLFELGVWRPEDGYGVPVIAPRDELIDCAHLPQHSARSVLHLHGTLLVYPVDFFIENHRTSLNMLRPKEQADFAFHPDALGPSFLGFEQGVIGPAYQLPHQRIIAPVRDKASGLHGAFVREVHRLAASAVQEAEMVVAIGYRFNPSDRSSYDELLRLIIGKLLVIVSPDAHNVREQLHTAYPGVHFDPQASRFVDWVHAGYPGVVACVSNREHS